jgi:transcriptional regulator with PAS, ATPase and Fis domain
MFTASSNSMQQLRRLIAKVAPSNATVNIYGETGVGKELVAKALHKLSPRRDKPFIQVNCSAFPETLLESELFGYEKGAFTGAMDAKPGRFELASGGTIFLDEIGDISPVIQLKLLRVIQQKEVERLGSNKTIPLDIRVITATNKDLKKLVSEHRFREDLFYRLNVIPIEVMPLRERKEDIPLLIETFIGEVGSANGTGQKRLADEALTALLNYSWPGNVRELENVVERLMIISDGPVIGLPDLPDYMAGKDKEAFGMLDLQKDQVEEKVIREALDEAQGNVTRAAEIIGISRRTLYRKLHKHAMLGDGDGTL